MLDPLDEEEVELDELDEPPETLCPTVPSTATTSPAIGAVSVAAARFCCASVSARVAVVTVGLRLFDTALRRVDLLGAHRRGGLARTLVGRRGAGLGLGELGLRAGQRVPRVRERRLRVAHRGVEIGRLKGGDRLPFLDRLPDGHVDRGDRAARLERRVRLAQRGEVAGGGDARAHRALLHGRGELAGGGRGATGGLQHQPGGHGDGHDTGGEARVGEHRFRDSHALMLPGQHMRRLELFVDCLWTPALDSGGDAAGPGSRQRAPSMRTVASASVQDTDGVGVPDRSHAPQRGDRCEPSASLRPAGATPTTWNDGETASTR